MAVYLENIITPAMKSTTLNKSKSNLPYIKGIKHIVQLPLHKGRGIDFFKIDVNGGGGLKIFSRKGGVGKMEGGGVAIY